MTHTAQAAQLEVEAVSAASASVVAEQAAQSAVLAADLATAQATAQAAEQISAVTSTVNENENDISWLRTQVAELRTEVTTMRSSTSEILALAKEHLIPKTQAASNPSTPEPVVSSVVEVDPLAAPKLEPAPKAEVPTESQPVKKRHRLI